MRDKKLALLLGVLMLLVLSQTILLVDTASAYHSCNRPPYDCHCVAGQLDWRTSKVYPFRFNEEGEPIKGEPIDVTLDKDMKEHVDKLARSLTDKNLETIRGFIILSKKEGRHYLEEFIPAEALQGNVRHFDVMFPKMKK